MDRVILWRSLDYLVRERVIIPSGFAGDPDLVDHGDGTFTASVLGALAIAVVGPRRFGARGAMPDFAPVTVAKLVRCHSARELAMLDCLYRPKDVPEDRAECLRLGDRARIAVWLAGEKVSGYCPGSVNDDPESVLRSYYAWRMRRVIDVVQATYGDVGLAALGSANAA